jgi:acetyl esterase/lipase
VALPYETLPGDIDHLIADDHAVVERQFQHLEAGRGNRRALVDQISFELAAHAFAEETVLDPLRSELGIGDEQDDAHSQHQHMRRLLAVLDAAGPGEPQFEEALSELVTTTRRHVHDEERQELPEVRARAGAERMAELGRQFLAAKRKVPVHSHSSAPDLATDASGLLDPQAQAIVDAQSALEALPLTILTPDQAREQPGPDAAVRKLLQERGLGWPEQVGSVRDIQIPDADDGLQILRIYTPAGVDTSAAVIMWIHGGGWVLFDLDTYDASCRALCNKTGAIVVSPDYRRAPEAAFPAAYDDVITAYRWVMAHTAEIGGDPRSVGIGGESVGGTMAIATTLRLAQGGEPVPSAVVAVYPLTTGEQYGASMEDAADARPLDRPLLSWMAMHAFEGVPDGVKDPRVDLLSVPPAELALLPPTLVITAERDVLRSQAEQFVVNLDAAGVDVEHLHYDGVMHEFFGASAVLDQAETAQIEAARRFLTAFGARPGGL